jgi:general secretion pathway protein C
MLDTRTTDWPSRLRVNGPHYVSFALAALIAVELARLAITTLNGPVKSPAPVLTRATQPQRRQGVDVQSVMSAHLFGVATVDPASQDPATAPLSSANLVLAGTIATQNPKRGVAIISDGGPGKVYGVGDNVNGASLYSVYLDHVILDRAGALETLVLPRLMAGGRAEPGVRRPPAARSAAVENIRRMVQQDPGLLDQVMRTVPSYDNVAGRLRGFRAYPGRNRGLFGKLGLKPGDLVTAINGTVLDDPQHSQEVLNTIQSSDHVTVTIERAGVKQDISLNVGQVAEMATKDLEGDPSNASSVPNVGGGTPPPNPPNSTNETTNDQ